MNPEPVYVLKVALDNNKTIWRKIAIRGGQTLQDLHEIIFEAFDREEEHLYSFYIPNPFIQFKSKDRMLRSAIEYAHPLNLEESFVDDRKPQNAATTSILSLGLAKKQKLLYLFDFGDEWWHEVTVEQAGGVLADEESDYPRILQKNGHSPAQYERGEE